MTEPKFTPGPWHSDDYGYIWAGESKDAHMIAEVRGWGWIQYLPNPEQIQDANRDLIAAAPELYGALDELTRMVESLLRVSGNPESGSFGGKAKAALAKARGESHE